MARGAVRQVQRNAVRGVGRLGGYAPDQGARPTAGQNTAGVLLALVVYPILANLLIGGPGRAWGWITAKWINEPYGSTSPLPVSGNNAFGPGGANSGAPAPGSPITTTALYRTAPLPAAGIPA